MIYLQLFLNFLMIGTVSFGGGYGMISLIRETVISNEWLAESEFLNMIAVSESTPGPLAINMATFVGSTQGGFFGALAATFGVVLPSFIIISLIALAMKRLMKHGGVQAFLKGIRPCIIAMILATALIMALETLFGFSAVGSDFAPNIKRIAMFAVIAAAAAGYKLLRKKQLSPIILLLFSAVLGVLFYAL